MWQDLRFGLRMLRKSPGFTAVAVLTIAISIGATTAIFSVFKAMVLQPLPFYEPDRLVMLWERGPKHGDQRDAVNRQLYAYWKEQNSVCSEMSYIWNFSYMTRHFRLVESGTIETIQGRYVPSDFFRVFGVEPIIGRTFAPEEDVHNPDPMVVISHHFWKQSFGGDANAIGRTVTLQNHKERRPYRIIGVMPRGFEFPTECQIWLPAGVFRPPPKPVNSGRKLDGKGHDLLVFARLKPGVTVEQASADLTTISARLVERFPDAWFGSEVDVVPLRDELVGDLKSAMWVLVGAVTAVLLIACANVANLLLARAATREREIALRMALGAGRGRVMRQLFTEGLLLAVISGLPGVLLAVWGVKALANIVPAAGSSESHAGLVQSQAVRDVPIDGVVLAVAIGVTLLTGVLFGLAPMIHAWKQNLTESLNATGRGSTRNRAGQRVLHVLVCGQVAGAIVLLIAAVLMMQSFARLLHVDPGFNPQGLLTGTIEFSGHYTESMTDRYEVTRQILGRVQKILGVVSASGIHELPLVRPGRWTRIVIREDQQHAPSGTPLATADLDPVTPNYFRTMQISLLSGRQFNDLDNRENPPVAIINQKLALRLWPDGTDPVGRKIGVGHSLGNSWRMQEIVGVVGDTRSLRLDQPGPATIYFPFGQMWPGGTTVLNLIVRTNDDPMTLAESLRDEVLSVTLDEPITRIRTIESVFEGSVANSKFQMSLLGIFAAVALVLAALGIYGVVSWWVTSRIREIGIRIALGAQPCDVMKKIVAHSLKLTTIGVSIGLAGAWSLTRVLQSQLYETPPVDSALFISIALLLLLVSIIASIIPARRAMQVDPMTALRCE
jgi:putative ABC transport system permease protein